MDYIDPTTDRAEQQVPFDLHADFAPDLAGKQFGRYRVKGLIASGGMGSVYEAVQDKPRRTVAVKVMKPGLASRSALRQFEYESQFLARLRHPGIAVWQPIASIVTKAPEISINSSSLGMAVISLLFALLISDDLAEANMIGRGPGTHHMNRRLRVSFVITAPKRLSIDRNNVAIADLLKRGDPTQQTLFKFVGANPSQDGVEAIMRRNPRGQIKILGEPVSSGVTELRDCHEIIRAADHRAHGDEEDVLQRIDRFSSSRISRNNNQ